ncbi:MAG: YceI family protein [Bacteriovoracaceae bacterium]|nr:YceI family protein [Bacteriovoracaceae bacterium]
MKIWFILCSLVFSTTTFAAEWVINKDHSEILFKVDYLNVSELTGRFSEYSGKVEIDDKSGLPKNITITVLTNSIDTGHKMRDNHLSTNDFFESRQYPELIFKSSDIKNVGNNQFKANGVLTIKNVNRPTLITFSLTDSVTDTWGYENKFVKFQSKLNRRDFKLNWNKTLDNNKYLVGDEVSYWGVFQIQPSKALTPSSKHMLPDTEYIRQREDKLRKDKTEAKDESAFSKKLRNLINGK